MHIKNLLQSQLARVIRERCNDCYNFTTAFFRRGVFLCHGNPTMVTYRTILVNPFPTTNSSQLIGLIQDWVSTNPFLDLDCLLVRVSANCPTSIDSLGERECVGAVQSNSGLSERISQVLSVCAVRQLGEQICTV